MKTTKTSTKKISVSDLPKKKQLGFMSCILVVVGACIGAGIFFKNGSILKNTQGSIVLSVISWLIAAVGVIAMALCLTEIVSGQKKQSNLGIAAWVKTFNTKYLYNSCKNFIAYMYTPVILVSLAYYFVQAIFQGIAPEHAFPWWAIMLIALGVLFWFFFTSGLSVRFFNVQNWIIMSVKFLPIVFALLIGFIYVGVGNDAANTPMPSPDWKTSTPLLNQLTPICGIIASIPAIFFAFNGFTYPANLTSDMKDPKKLPATMTVGLIIVTIIYIGISVSMLISSANGGIDGLVDSKTGWQWLIDHKWIYTLVYILIAVGILSVINGTVTTSVKIYQDLIVANEIAFSKKLNFGKKFNGKPMAGVIYGLVATLVFFAVCTIIGMFFSNTGNLSSMFDEKTQGIFSFVDIASNWDVLFIYMFIAVAVLGCLINRKTHKVKVVKSNVFKPAAWVTLVLMSISMLYLFVSVFVDIGLVSHYISQGKYASDTEKNNALLAAILSAVMFVLYIGVIFVPSWITEKRFAYKR